MELRQRKKETSVTHSSKTRPDAGCFRRRGRFSLPSLRSQGALNFPGGGAITSPLQGGDAEEQVLEPQGAQLELSC